MPKKTFEPATDTALWAITLADWFFKGSPLDEASWNLFNRRARTAPTAGSPEDTWSDDRLDELIEATLGNAGDTSEDAQGTAGGDGPSTRDRETARARTAKPTTAAASSSILGAVTPGIPSAIGIDLGTTYSVAAYLDPKGRPTSILNSHGDLLTPSVVLFEDERGGRQGGGRRLGPRAGTGRRCVKRDIGAKKHRKPINGREMPPEVISSMILRQLKADADRRLGPVTKAVITVPAYFDEPRRRRRSTLDGSPALRSSTSSMNQPPRHSRTHTNSACSISRGGGKDEKPFKALVYDLGGGTFDITVVELKTNSFRALATDGDVYLGGKDWDAKVVEIAARRFGRSGGATRAAIRSACRSSFTPPKRQADTFGAAAGDAGRQPPRPADQGRGHPRGV